MVLFLLFLSVARLILQRYSIHHWTHQPSVLHVNAGAPSKMWASPALQLVLEGMPREMVPEGAYLRSLAVQEAQGAQEGPGVLLFHLVLAKTPLDILGHLFLLFHQGSQEHQPAQVSGCLKPEQKPPLNNHKLNVNRTNQFSELLKEK